MKDIHELVYDITISVLCSLVASFLMKKSNALVRNLSTSTRRLYFFAHIPTIMIQKKIRKLASNCREKIDCYMQTSVTRLSIFVHLAKIGFSTVVGVVSIDFVILGFLIAASYGTGINERTLGECAIGFSFCLFMAWFVNWHFHRLIRA